MDDDMLKGTRTAVPTYASREDWETVLNLLPAAERENPVTYDDWVKRRDKMEDEAKRRGAIPEAVEIRPDALKIWCEKQGIDISRESIRAYAMTMLGERIMRERKSGG
jgi:hypothetical protein